MLVNASGKPRFRHLMTDTARRAPMASSVGFTGRLLMVLCAFVAATSACGHDGPRLLNQAGSTMIAATLPDTVANKPYTFSDMPLCVDPRGTVVVVGARIVHPHGLLLHQFGTVPHHIVHSLTFKSLWRSGFRPGQQEVHTDCKRPASRVGFEFYRRPGMTGTGKGVRLRYRSDDGLHSLTVPFQVTLCKAGDVTTGRCYHDPRPDPHARAVLHTRRDTHAG